MSWLFSRALVEEFSPGTSLAGKPLSQLSVMPTAQQFWRRDKTMESSGLSRFGLTFQRLTRSRGEELLTSYLEAFRAKTSAARENVSVSQAVARACGSTWRAPSMRWDATSSTWKILQSLWDGDSASFLETWPRWGSMLNGESSAQPAPTLTTSESASGFWPTPTKSNGGRSMSKEQFLNGVTTVQGVKRQIGLETAVRYRQWPTPTACMSKGSSPAPLVRAAGKSRANDRLDHAVLASVLYPTPTKGNKHSGGYLAEWGGSRSRQKNALFGARGRTVWPAESGLGRMADGVAHRVDRLAALGNGQVPRVASAAWELLFHRMTK